MHVFCTLRTHIYMYMYSVCVCVWVCVCVHTCTIALSLLYSSLLVGIASYFIIGTIVMYTAKGARGTEMIPNYLFWKGLPGLIKVCVCVCPPRKGHCNINLSTVDNSWDQKFICKFVPPRRGQALYKGQSMGIYIVCYAHVQSCA